MTGGPASLNQSQQRRLEGRESPGWGVRSGLAGFLRRRTNGHRHTHPGREGDGEDAATSPDLQMAAERPRRADVWLQAEGWWLQEKSRCSCPVPGQEKTPGPARPSAHKHSSPSGHHSLGTLAPTITCGQEAPTHGARAAQGRGGCWGLGGSRCLASPTLLRDQRPNTRGSPTLPVVPPHPAPPWPDPSTGTGRGLHGAPPPPAVTLGPRGLTLLKGPTPAPSICGVCSLTVGVQPQPHPTMGYAP